MSLGLLMQRRCISLSACLLRNASVEPLRVDHKVETKGSRKKWQRLKFMGRGSFHRKVSKKLTNPLFTSDPIEAEETAKFRMDSLAQSLIAKGLVYFHFDSHFYSLLSD